MKLFKTCIFLLICAHAGFCQTRIIDSLKLAIASEKIPEKKLDAVFALCDQSSSLNPDTMRSYLVLAAKLTQAVRSPHSIVLLSYYNIINLMVKGAVDSALAESDRCLALVQAESDPIFEAKVQQQRGKCFIRKNEYRPAAEAGYAAMALGEKANDTATQVKARILLGWTYMEMGQMKQALQWHLSALHASSDSAVYIKNPVLYANLCTNYTMLNQPDSAMYFANKAISLARRDENLSTLANALAMRSELSEKQGDITGAEAALKEVVAIRKIIGDPFYIAADMSELGYFYAHNGLPKKGIEICNEGIAIIKKYGLRSKLFFLYGSLAENYRAAGDIKSYAGVLENIIALKDSVYSENSANALAEIRGSYEIQKKENLIIRQQLALRKRNYLVYGSLVVLLFASVLGWLLFREYRRRQTLRVIEMQEAEKIRSAVAVTKAEETERKRIAADLHDNLGAYAAAIASNVDMLSLTHGGETSLNELKINSQSIVSQLNDTIWVLKKDNLSLTAISDRIKVFINQIMKSYPQINIDVIERISSDILLPPAVAFNVYRVIKEALINAVKHSAGNHVRVYFETEKDWKITIADDGRGMTDAEKKMGRGNGILNMRNRGAEAGFSVNWEKNDPDGTYVILRPTTN